MSKERRYAPSVFKKLIMVGLSGPSITNFSRSMSSSGSKSGLTTLQTKEVNSSTWFPNYLTTSFMIVIALCQ